MSTVLDLCITEMIKAKYNCAIKLLSVGAIDFAKVYLIQVREMRYLTHIYTCI